MKKKPCYLLNAILFSMGGVILLIAAIINNTKEFSAAAPLYAVYLNRFGFYIAAICFLTAGAGFLYSYLRGNAN